MHAPDDDTTLDAAARAVDAGLSPDGLQPAVTVTSLVKRYGSFVAVDDVSFSIREGEIFGIIGPNGAGKTTTVECISGLRAPDSGSISIYGLSPQRDRGKITEFMGVQLQKSALPPRLKVGEALQLFASFYANPLDPREVLESLGITGIERAAFKKLFGAARSSDCRSRWPWWGTPGSPSWMS